MQMCDGLEQRPHAVFGLFFEKLAENSVVGWITNLRLLLCCHS